MLSWIISIFYDTRYTKYKLKHEQSFICVYRNNSPYLITLLIRIQIIDNNKK